ncbi:MAG TPA: DUF72 domain-containing protein [Afifellaceae bacterium]|nr:DUF72 domain-containing protein [Afifellaceae bacterium]
MIRVGIGGWTYPPWRGTFYPADLKQADELGYASRRLTTIEINATFYRTQTPASFRKWRDETPDGFVFSIKGNRNVVNSRKLAETGERIDWFFKSGVLELGDQLGPVLWQFAPFRAFDAADFAAFLALLPTRADGRDVRHAVEVRHDSFRVPQFTSMLREHNVAAVYADSDDHPAIADLTADFVYVHLRRAQDDLETGYPAADLDRWAARARVWQSSGAPEDLPRIDETAATKLERPVFIYVISGDKVRAPAAAMAIIERLSA